MSVQGRIEQHNRSDATRHVGYLACLAGGQSPTQQRVLAIAEPFLDDLIATDSILPDAGLDIAPVGGIVQINIAGRCTQTMESKRLLNLWPGDPVWAMPLD